MRYKGMYPVEVIPTLKAALADRYGANDFCGGRGPHKFRLPGESVWYENAWTGDFTNFQGTETVLRFKESEEGALSPSWRVREELGRHDYSGMMMVD